MDLRFRRHDTDGYRGASQIAKALTEGWAERSMYCPACGHARLRRDVANRPVSDFICVECHEVYELKSQKTAFGRRVADDAYRTMIERLRADSNPNLFLLHYDGTGLQVRSLTVVPRQFFTADLIEQRPPLSTSARRAGWVGCNIILDKIPLLGRIAIIRDGAAEPQPCVLASWRETLFLRNTSPDTGRGWLIAIMNCIEQLHSDRFTLDDLYKFETDLARQFPDNRNIRPKIRQQLQRLRDQHFLEFLGNGHYRLSRVEPPADP